MQDKGCIKHVGLVETFEYFDSQLRCKTIIAQGRFAIWRQRFHGFRNGRELV